MIRKSTIAKAGIVAALALSINTAKAQDIHFTQFTAAPLIINPAFTGNFDGSFRAAAIYRNQWKSVTVPYVTYGASVDLPVIRDLSIDDYLAVGMQLYNDRAGDGNLNNFTGMLSVAYHKFLGSSENPNKTISVGLQGGYAQKSIDLTKLYFQDEYFNGSFDPGTSQEYHLGINNSVSYFLVNAGVSWAHAISPRFGYALGAGANNLNQPNDGFKKQSNSQVGLGMRYTGQAGAIGYLSDRFSLRPGILYQNQATANELIAGNEFHYLVGDPEFQNFSTAIFLGGWYRTGDAIMITAGVEFKGFRFGVAYDYNVSSLNTASNGNGGFELSLVYKAPDPLTFAKRLLYPCARF